MDNNIKTLIENELYKRVVTPIEVYIREIMTVSMKCEAKAKVYPEILKEINTFSREHKVDANEVVDLLKQIIENKDEERKRNCAEQFQLVTEMLDNIKSEKEENER